MEPAAPADSPEKRNVIEETTEYLRYAVSREDLQLLLTEEGAWEAFVAEAELSRAEATNFREALSELTASIAVKDDSRLQNDREWFVDSFPQVKLECEEHIRKLRALADKVDKVHRDCTISSVVADTTSTVSGVLTLLGLALVPVTAGTSLVLLATGMGLGAAAAVTSISTDIVDHANKLSAQTEASHLVSTSMDKVKVVAGTVAHSVPKVFSLSQNCFRVVKCIERTIDGIKLIKTNPALTASAKCFTTTGRISVQSGKQVKKAFKGTPLALSRRARIMGAATAGVSLLMDVLSLVKESKHLHEGAKTRSAEVLRQQAQELEEKLERLVWIYDSLQSGQTQ
uniref:Apolipoprotein L 8 n=1 Tax=Nannospalax galili TaxID=1026970 RepID=A0A8C6RD24_NANGA